MAEAPVKITKIGGEETPKTYVKPPMALSVPSLAGSKKTLKTFPRGILKTHKAKIHPVSNPSRGPPIKSSMEKHTIRILTDKGIQRQRKTIKRKISKMSDKKVKEVAMKAGLVNSQSTPPNIVRSTLESAMIAGFVSLD